MLSFKTIPVVDFKGIGHEFQPSPYTSYNETQILLSVISQYPDPQVLEIGTARGETTVCLANLLARIGGHCITVDIATIDEDLPEDQKCEVPMGHEAEKVAELLEPIDEVDRYLVSKDCPLDRVLTRYANYTARPQKFLDVVFLDGNHSREGVLRDLAIAKDFLREGGVILFHDIWWDVNPPPLTGPMNVLTELGGCVINMTHMGILKEHAGNL